MDGIKIIEEKELQDIAGRTGFNLLAIVKDYYITLLLYLLKDINGLYFKGGTALQKIFFNHSRLSEDIDYTATKNVDGLKSEIEKILKKSTLFEKTTKDKHVSDFVRLVVYYKDPFGNTGNVFIDLNKRANLILKPEKYEIPHMYTGHIPKFSVNTLNIRELCAEKMAAAMGRNKPRDHFDLYKIVSNGLPIDLEIVRKKCKSSGFEFDITKMFKNANKLKNRWDEDIEPLLAEKTTFKDVMRKLAVHFKYAEEKRLKKQQIR